MSLPVDTFHAHREELRSLIDHYRTRCLWFLREDYYPTTAEEALSVLQQIERNADLEGFRRAGRLRAWLSPTSNAPSVAS